jgi:hypothetical protein
MHVVSKGDATEMADYNRSYRRMILRGAARHKLEETTNKQTNKRSFAPQGQGASQIPEPAY